MINGYQGYFPNKAFFPSVLMPYREKKTHLYSYSYSTYSYSYSFIGRVDENEHGFQNGGFLTLASYLKKLSIKLVTNFLS